MTNLRFLHTSDWQLGMTRHFLGADAQARFSAARLEAVRAIGLLASSRGCAFVVVCGDVFESNHIDRQVLVRAFEAMRAIPVPLYLLPGNHDPLDAASIYRSTAWSSHVPEHVRILDGFDPVEAAPGLRLWPAPWTTRRPLEDLPARAAGAVPDDPSTREVVVGHGIVDVLSPDIHDPALVGLAPLVALLDAGRIDYVALGDRHSATRVDDAGRVWYSGAPEVTDYDEVDPGCVLEVELDLGGAERSVRVTAHTVGTWRFHREQVVVNGSEDLAALAARLAALEGKDRTVLKLGFEGTLSLRDKADLDAHLEHLEDLFAAVELWERRTDLAVLPDEVDYEAMGLSGFAASAAEELVARAAGPSEDAAVARDALALLYRLARGGDA